MRQLPELRHGLAAAEDALADALAAMRPAETPFDAASGRFDAAYTGDLTAWHATVCAAARRPT